LDILKIQRNNAAERSTEVCVYGGTASGLLSAIAIAKSGRQVLVIEPSRWLGGMTGGGIRPRHSCVYPQDIGGLTKMILHEDDSLGTKHAYHGQAQISAFSIDRKNAAGQFLPFVGQKESSFLAKRRRQF
jgi:flavin-dependent dehydrogenase